MLANLKNFYEKLYKLQELSEPTTTYKLKPAQLTEQLQLVST